MSQQFAFNRMPRRKVVINDLKRHQNHAWKIFFDNCRKINQRHVSNFPFNFRITKIQETV